MRVRIRMIKIANASLESDRMSTHACNLRMIMGSVAPFSHLVLVCTLCLECLPHVMSCTLSITDTSLFTCTSIISSGCSDLEE